MSEKQFSELMHRLDIMTRLLAWNILQGKESLTEQAVTLSSLGLEAKDIVTILGKDQHFISQTLYQAKKSKGGKKGATTSG
jgi:uncharacterized protein YciW